MRNTLTSLGLDGTTLQIRDVSGNQPKVIKEISSGKLDELVELLQKLGDKVHILQRRGLDFETFIAQRKDGKLPTHWMVINNENVFCYSKDEYEQMLEKYKEQATVVEEEGENGNGHEATAPRIRIQQRAELHEVKAIEAYIAELEKRGLPIEDYFTVREEKVTGEKDPAKYLLMNEEEPHELDNIGMIAPGIREIGSEGIEIKRFKGLGEMNADELWETTMDPERRVLLRVRADEAEEAERMFSLLMGDSVQPRRKFIEDNALDVKNLDV
jgi:DNA gyrase subunit B